MQSYSKVVSRSLLKLSSFGARSVHRAAHERPHHPGGHKPATPQKILQAAPSLGIIRIDYDYPPAKGDIDCPDSFPYDVFYKVVPGLTFEMCQSGTLTEEVEENFKNSIQWL